MKQKNIIVLILGGAVLVAGLIFFSGASPHKEASESPMPAFSLAPEVLAARFEHLSAQRTNSCGGGKDYVAWLSDDGERIQGSCCSAMVLSSYIKQVEGLDKYREYSIIPPDPYDVSAEWAEEMIEYGEQTELTPEQQVVYDEAVEMSHEGGPCCCMCWHWYAYDGLAKHLIIHENFSAEQVAEVWDLSDACGGEHEHH